jgi:competence protein ComGC
MQFFIRMNKGNKYMEEIKEKSNLRGDLLVLLLIATLFTILIVGMIVLDNESVCSKGVACVRIA